MYTAVISFHCSGSGGGGGGAWLPGGGRQCARHNIIIYNNIIYITLHPPSVETLGKFVKHLTTGYLLPGIVCILKSTIERKSAKDQRLSMRKQQIWFN